METDKLLKADTSPQLQQTNKQNLDVNKPCTAVFVFDNLGAHTLLATVIQLSVQA